MDTPNNDKFDKDFEVTWLPGDYFEKFVPAKQAYRFCFNKAGKLLVQQKQPGPWQVMGGTIEPEEMPEETLVRELAEEVNIEVTSIKYIGAQKVVEPSGKVVYQLRFAAMIKKLNKRFPDPANGITRKRKFINPDDYEQISKWGSKGTAMVKEARRKLGI